MARKVIAEAMESETRVRRILECLPFKVKRWAEDEELAGAIPGVVGVWSAFVAVSALDPERGIPASVVDAMHRGADALDRWRMTRPPPGNWRYAYDAFGELVRAPLPRPVHFHEMPDGRTRVFVGWDDAYDLDTTPGGIRQGSVRTGGSGRVIR